MINNKNLTYEAPYVELIEVQVEQGFATSGGASGTTNGFGESEGEW